MFAHTTTFQPAITLCGVPALPYFANMATGASTQPPSDDRYVPPAPFLGGRGFPTAGRPPGGEPPSSIGEWLQSLQGRCIRWNSIRTAVESGEMHLEISRRFISWYYQGNLTGPTLNAHYSWIVYKTEGGVDPWNMYHALMARAEMARQEIDWQPLIDYNAAAQTMKMYRETVVARRGSSSERILKMLDLEILALWRLRKAWLRNSADEKRENAIAAVDAEIDKLLPTRMGTARRVKAKKHL